MKLKTIIFAAFLAVLTMCAAQSCSSILFNFETPMGLEIGETVPEFSFTTIEGNRVSNKDYAGSHYAIFVFKTDCGFCQARAIQLNRIYPDLNGFPILGLSASDEKETMDFVNEKKLPFPVALPDNVKTIQKFAVGELPVLMLFDEEGVFRLCVKREELTDEDLVNDILYFNSPLPDTNKEENESVPNT